MTLEHNGNLAIASTTLTPISNCFTNPITFSASTELTSREMTEWINGIIDFQKPDKLILKAKDRLSIKALGNSRGTWSNIPSHHSSLPPWPHSYTQTPTYFFRSVRWMALHVECLDLVKFCHKQLQSQQKIDFRLRSMIVEECENLRRKAEILAGTYEPASKPSTWSAVGPRHFEI